MAISWYDLLPAITAILPPSCLDLLVVSLVALACLHITRSLQQSICLIILTCIFESSVAWLCDFQARMYRDPKRWAYLFQSYVLLTMMDAHETPQTKRLRVMERSVYSARYVLATLPHTLCHSTHCILPCNRQPSLPASLAYFIISSSSSSSLSRFFSRSFCPSFCSLSC